MIGWEWIPGTVVAAGAAGHSAWLHRHFNQQVRDRANELYRQVMDQYMHGLMLWPRPWLAKGRPLTQVEELTQAGYGWVGQPIDTEEQRQQMMRDAQRLLDSYRPPGERDEP